MAAHITHLALAKYFLEKYWSGVNEENFFTGNIFPDIRYLNTLSRDKTHFPNATLNEIFSCSSFIGGVKFHSVVDNIYGQILDESHIYKFISEVKFRSQATKYVLDKIIYYKLPDWNFINVFSDKVLDEEIKIVKDPNIIRKWHAVIKNYICHIPCNRNIKDLVRGLGVDKSDYVDLKKAILLIESNDIAMKKLDNFYSLFKLKIDAISLGNTIKTKQDDSKIKNKKNN